MVIHVVQSGETIWAISRIYGVNYQEIAQINELPDPNRLVPGQALVIPTEEAATHTVQPGETLWSIANRYGISVQSIIQVNGIINPNLIYPGTVLIIPRGVRPKSK
jgi:spore germination protein